MESSAGRGAIRHRNGRREAGRGWILLDTARAGFGYYGMEEERQNGRRNGKDH